jgi:hypothetical protein
VEIKQDDWDLWKANAVTKEWFAMLRERQLKYEKAIPAHIAMGMPESIDQARIASGRHQELDDLINTKFEDMREAE